jgi:hypothetical protein
MGLAELTGSTFLSVALKTADSGAAEDSIIGTVSDHTGWKEGQRSARTDG